MELNMCVLPGDGIGPEVTEQTVRLLEVVGQKFHHKLNFDYGLIGGAAYDETGQPLPDATLDLCHNNDVTLLGAVGGPAWDHLPGDKRPEKGLLDLRQKLQVFANLRPIRYIPAVSKSSPLKSEYLEGVDLLVVRELTGGIYFGEKSKGIDKASDLCAYQRHEIERVIRVAAQMAKQRRGKLCSIDKANVLETSRFWREVSNKIMTNEFPEITLTHCLVDAAAAYLIQSAAQFDVIVTENMFGDILSDEASVLCGSLGLLPSASLGEGGVGLYEPVHGSAPDIAGKNLANPSGTMLSAALALRYSYSLTEEADAIDAAIDTVLQSGCMTKDLSPNDYVSTREFTDAVIQALG